MEELQALSPAVAGVGGGHLAVFHDPVVLIRIGVDEGVHDKGDDVQRPAVLGADQADLVVDAVAVGVAVDFRFQDFVELIGGGRNVQAQSGQPVLVVPHTERTAVPVPGHILGEAVDVAVRRLGVGVHELPVLVADLMEVHSQFGVVKVLVDGNENALGAVLGHFAFTQVLGVDDIRQRGVGGDHQGELGFEAVFVRGEGEELQVDVVFFFHHLGEVVGFIVLDQGIDLDADGEGDRLVAVACRGGCVRRGGVAACRRGAAVVSAAGERAHRHYSCQEQCQCFFALVHG